MKNKSTKILAVTVALIMVFCAFPMAANAENIVSGFCGAQGDNVSWTLDLDSGVVTISGEGEMDNNPDERWAEYSAVVTEVIIEDGVTAIGDNSFFDCRILGSVTIADTVESIGEWAFAQCICLQSVTLPSSLRSIGDLAFANCATLTSVEIPESVESIGSAAFANTSLTDIYIYGKDTQIGEMAIGYLDEGIDNRMITPEEFAALYRELYNCSADRAAEISGILSESKVNYDDIQVSENCVIHCYSNSSAEAYAVENGVKYVLFDNHGEHEYIIKVSTTADCFEDGIAIYRCLCGVTTEMEDSASHIEAPCEEFDPTCTEEGRTGGTYCKRCKEEITAPDVVKAKGHNEIAYMDIEATCTRNGRTGGTYCDVCGEQVVKPTTVKAKGHTAVAYEEIEATCTEEGRTGGTYCGVCSKELTAPAVVEAKGHSYGDWEYDYDNMQRTAVCGSCGDTKAEELEKTADGDVEIIAPENPDADFVVEEIGELSDKYIIVKGVLEENFGSDGWSIVKIFDINLKNKDGVHVQPDGTVKVKLPHDWKHENYKVYRVNDDGTVTDMNAYRQGSHVVFETDHFSIYVIVDESESVQDTEPEAPEEEETAKDFKELLRDFVNWIKSVVDSIKTFFRSFGGLT